MALFFNAAWFDERLASLGLSRANLAAALGLTDENMNEIWKDQRELSAREVAIMAHLLGTTGEIVATHAGVSTPVPRAGDSNQALARIEARLARIEELLAELLVRPRADH
jgi:hypothetical protein